jgi:hypothetical protein
MADLLANVDFELALPPFADEALRELAKTVF